MSGEVRQTNRERVLRALVQPDSPVAIRPGDLVRRTGLAPEDVARALDDLIADGLVCTYTIDRRPRQASGSALLDSLYGATNLGDLGG